VVVDPTSQRFVGTITCPPRLTLCTGNPCDTVDCDGRGTCSPTDGSCTCTEGYYGSDPYRCDKRACPRDPDNGYECGAATVCDPTTNPNCKGRCNVVDGTCQCKTGFRGAACEIIGCVPASPLTTPLPQSLPPAGKDD
jgi:hypothetical protein